MSTTLFDYKWNNKNKTYSIKKIRFGYDVKTIVNPEKNAMVTKSTADAPEFRRYKLTKWVELKNHNITRLFNTRTCY